jgi:hypothetical protein
MITLNTIFRYLMFDAPAIRRLAANPQVLIVGLLWVLSAGFAREYDGEYLAAEPWHVALPWVASVVGCGLMVALVGWAASCRGLQGVGPVEFCRTFLGLYWMTAPLAWLYAIPVERFLAPADATRANLLFLAVVSVWRVALMTRCVQVLCRAPLAAAAIPVLLFSDALALLALRFIPGPIFMIMGGVRLTESENIILGTRLWMGFLGGISLPIWVIAFAVLCTSKTRPAWRWYRSADDHAGEGDRDREIRGVSLPVAVVTAAALLVWMPILSWTQPPQRLRWTAERSIRSGDYPAISRLSREHSGDQFPRHWDPPPRLGYGERSPRVFEVFNGLVSANAADWLIDIYAQKLKAEAQGRRYWWDDLQTHSDEELQAYVATIQRLDHPEEIARYYQQVIAIERERPDLSDSRRAALDQLERLAGGEPAESP